MEVKRQITVELEGQQGSVELISETHFKGVRMFVFSSENFFGHAVTVGVRLDQTSEDVIRLYFKASLCSEDDVYKKETGEEIVLGRLVKADNQEPNMAMFIKKMNHSQVADTLNATIVSNLTSFTQLLFRRDTSYKLAEISEGMRRRALKEKFQQYK